MSIAVTVTLLPSRRLKAVAALLSVALTFTGFYCFQVHGQPLWLRVLTGVVCLVAATANLRQTRTLNARCWRIAIAGSGLFYCDTGTGAAGHHRGKFACELTSRSVLWPGILLLRLRRLDNDNMINLVILSDALCAEDFRRVSVACRWKLAQPTRSSVPKP